MTQHPSDKVRGPIGDLTEEIDHIMAAAAEPNWQRIVMLAERLRSLALRGHELSTSGEPTMPAEAHVYVVRHPDDDEIHVFASAEDADAYADMFLGCEATEEPLLDADFVQQVREEGMDDDG